MTRADQHTVPHSASAGERTRRRPAETGHEPPASHAIRVLCVEDHSLVVEGLRAQFAIDGAIEIVGHLTTAEQMVSEVERLRPHLVLLDIEMPGPDAFEMADRLRRACPWVRIVVLSAFARESYVAAAFNAGACAYFTKSDDVAEIITGLREVMQSPGGAFLLGPSLKQRFLPPADSEARSGRPWREAKSRRGGPGGFATPLTSLTPRELEVLRLIGKGMSRNEIASQLARSVKTIDGHQERMMRKLGIETRADLIRLAIREGLAQA